MCSTFGTADKTMLKTSLLLGVIAALADVAESWTLQRNVSDKVS